MKLYSYETLMRADYDENAQMSPSNDNNLMYRNFIVASASNYAQEQFYCMICHLPPLADYYSLPMQWLEQ